MAIVLSTEYANANAPSTDYPQGSFKNSADSSSFDGTPLEQAWQNDWAGFFQSLLHAALITPSGVPDTVTASDYYDALIAIIIKEIATSPTGKKYYLAADFTNSSTDITANASMVDASAFTFGYQPGDLVKFKVRLLLSQSGASSYKIALDNISTGAHTVALCDISVMGAGGEHVRIDASGSAFNALTTATTLNTGDYIVELNGVYTHLDGSDGLRVRLCTVGAGSVTAAKGSTFESEIITGSIS